MEWGTNMKKRFFIILFLFLGNLDLASASCQTARDAAFRDCHGDQVKEPLRLMEQVRAAANQSGAGTVPITELSIANGTTAQRQLQDFEIKCYSSFNSCINTCKQEAAQEQANMNTAAAQQAQQAERQCAEEPAQNHAAAKKGGMDLAQILPALIALLGQLKGDGGESGDECAKDPAKCKVDSATNTPGTTLSDNTTRDPGAGGFLDSGLNINDAPPMGEAAQASLAQFGQAPGGGGGMGAGSGSGGGRGRGVAEVNGDGTPKINLNGSGAVGGGRQGGMGSMGGASSKGSGNPIASRVGIDGDGRAGNGVGNAVDKALQARGLASGGEPGGISAAHAFDNFQKIEKRIQSERNKLAEL